MAEERKFTPDKVFFDALMSKGTALAENATPEQMAYLAKARKIMQESNPNRIYEDGMLNMPLHDDANPFLYCKIRRYGRGRGYAGYGATTNIGTLYNNVATAPKLFNHFTGGNNNHDLDTYSIPPMIQFVGPQARWIKSDGWLEYAANGNQTNYQTYEMILMFIKNTGTTNLTRTFGRYLSSSNRNGNYNYSSAYVGTPDQTNDKFADISNITWAVVHNYNSNTHGTHATFNVTIPAGKTIALLFYSTACYHTGVYNHYSFGSTIGIYEFENFLCDGLLVDHERTLRALQHRTQNIHEIWR